MKELQNILKYTKDLVEQEPEKSAYWHYNKLVSKIEGAIDVIHCCTELKNKEAPTFEEWKKDNFTSEINIHTCLKNGRVWGSTEIYSLYNWLHK